MSDFFEALDKSFTRVFSWMIDCFWTSLSFVASISWADSIAFPASIFLISSRSLLASKEQSLQGRVGGRLTFRDSVPEVTRGLSIVWGSKTIDFTWLFADAMRMVVVINDIMNAKTETAYLLRYGRSILSNESYAGWLSLINAGGDELRNCDSIRSVEKNCVLLLSTDNVSTRPFLNFQRNEWEQVT